MQFNYLGCYLGLFIPTILRRGSSAKAHTFQGVKCRSSNSNEDTDPHGLEGFTGQTPKPLNRPLTPLSKHEKFVVSLKCLKNFENF